MDHKNKKTSINKSLSAIGLGYTMMAAMVLFAFLGHWADQKSGGGYKWTLTGLLLGFFMGLYETWKMTLKLNKEDTKTKN